MAVPNKKMGKYKKMVMKNKAGFGILASIFGLFIYFALFVEQRTPEMTHLEETCEANIYEWNAQRDKQVAYLQVAVGEPGPLFTWWSGLTAWQRQSLIEDTVKANVEGPLPALFQKIKVPNLGSLFGSAVPDVGALVAGFAKEADSLPKLYAAVVSGNDRAAMSDEAKELFEGNANFWGGMDVFSEEEQTRFRTNSWRAARGMMVSSWLRTLIADIHDKMALETAGEELEWPDEPVPDPTWREEGAVDVVHLEEDDSAVFDALLQQQKHALVMFYAPWCGHCKKFKPDLTRVSELTRERDDLAIIGVDATICRLVANRFNVSGYPTMVYFKDGQRIDVEFNATRTAHGTLVWLDEETRLNGQLADLAESIKPAPVLTWAEEGAVDVIHADDDSFDAAVEASHALVMFYAPWCGHCKSFKPTFAAAATQWKDAGIHFVGVDSTISSQVSARFEVKGYPTIKHFADAKLVGDFDGERTRDGISTFLFLAGAINQKEEL